MAFHIFQRFCVFGISDFLFLVQQTEYAFCSRQGGEDFVDNVCKFVDGAGKFTGVENEGGDLAQINGSEHKGDRTQHGDQSQRDVADTVHGGAAGHTVIIGFVIAVGSIVVDRVEILADSVFVSVCLNGFLSAEHLLHKAVHNAVIFGALGITGLGALAQPCGIVDRNGNGKNNYHGQQRGDGEHHDQGADHRHHTGQNRDDIGGKAGADHINIVGNTADDIAGLIGVEKSDGQTHQFVEYVPTHVPRYQLTDVGHNDVDEDGHQRGGYVKQQHPLDIVHNHVKVDLACACRSLVDGGAGQVGAK